MLKPRDQFYKIKIPRGAGFIKYLHDNYPKSVMAVFNIMLSSMDRSNILIATHSGIMCATGIGSPTTVKKAISILKELNAIKCHRQSNSLAIFINADIASKANESKHESIRTYEAGYELWRATILIHKDDVPSFETTNEKE